MREPRFWSREVDPRSREAAPLLRFLLTPFAWGYAVITRQRIRRVEPISVPATVICIGNLTAGGVGKSPVVAALRAHIEDVHKRRVATLSRGYKGRLKGPIRVDTRHHTASDVGDEPLMLAAAGEAWIGADRATAGTAMSAAGVEVILMDDGHQNPSLAKDLTIIVVDASAGFGNGFVIPKGPLREPVRDGLSRADAIIIMGEGTPPAELARTDLPTFHGRLVPLEVPLQQPYVAFAGIGRPEKFFDTLTALGADLRDSVPFADHHAFTDADLRYLRRLADDHSAQLITTEKDFARLPQEKRENIHTLPVAVQFDRPTELDTVIASVIRAETHGQD